MTAILKESNGAVLLPVRVTPRSNKNEIVRFDGDVLKVRLKAPPVDGKANEALVKFLAQEFRVPASNIEITRGHASRTKVLSIRGISAKQVEETILASNRAPGSH
jgi:uncharacterized protein